MVAAVGEALAFNSSVPSTTTESDESLVTIPAETARLEGELLVYDGASGLVVFAHGSGSSRLSPRNNYVAEVLGTLLFDLLTESEDRVPVQRPRCALQPMEGTTSAPSYLVAGASTPHPSS